MSENDYGIMVVDDEFGVRDSLTRWLKADNYRVAAAVSAKEALHHLEEESWDVALIDLKMPGMDGLELLRRIQNIDENLAVIMITAYATVDTAVEAMKLGAYDYVTKPFDPDDISRLIKKALERRSLATENVRLKSNILEMAGEFQIVGESPQLHKALDLVRLVAKTDSTVLIRGESGTGKELFARAIHNQSRRRFCPIVPVNCGAFPDTLLESELFGHEKGAFTGAQYRRKGRFELADGGTIFLDEISTMSPKTQVDLLRIIETKQVMRLGGSKPIDLDFRVVCATNENLETLVKEGRIREDLYYRINVFTIHIPPLRERRSDIPILAEHFAGKYAQTMNKPLASITDDAMDILIRYSWPGNVRELENVIERALVVSRSQAIAIEDLPISLPTHTLGPDGDSLLSVEKAHILRILSRTDWNITQTAKILGVDRSTIYQKIKRYELART